MARWKVTAVVGAEVFTKEVSVPDDVGLTGEEEISIAEAVGMQLIESIDGPLADEPDEVTTEKI